jgi:HEAT repeat protein
MTDTTPNQRQILEALQAEKSVTRRAAARRIRRLKDPSLGPAVIDALRRELANPDAWETQYHLIMALGEAGYEHALSYLRDIVRRQYEATMIYAALGDAIVRLGRRSENDPTPVREMMATSNGMLIDGAFRAVAMLRLTLDADAVEAIVAYASPLHLDDGLRFWVAAAAAGWHGPAVERFLAECVTSPREDVRTAATSSQQGKYRRWRPL